MELTKPTEQTMRIRIGIGRRLKLLPVWGVNRLSELEKARGETIWWVRWLVFQVSCGRCV